ncbi:hypothetical protein F0562_025063 [Nyssa sinensis]|uniref:Uncharacterized protein n=1 Tax=Nyssa sinensis TaxID=561372 RepID=A0A5J5BFQ9_9ASTE|nr:hypothetical protein F0562_025063 [Nyssa sinensis]
MVSIRFKNFVLGIMLIFLALRDSVAYTYQVTEKVVPDGSPFNFEKVNCQLLFHNKAKVIICSISKTNTLQEFFDAIPAAAEAKSTGRLGGRKMMEKRVLGKETAANEEGVNGGASKISGATHSVGNYNHKGRGKLNVEQKLSGSRPHPVNVKMDGTSMLKPKPLISGRLKTSGKVNFDVPNSNQLCSQDSKADSSRGRLECSKNLVPDQESDEIDTSQKLESQKLPAETATEMVNLMNKDYQGAGKAQHKPPINN